MKKPNKHLAAVDKAISDVTTKICDEMFVDTLPEARALMASMPNEHHVLELRDERGELEFLNKRRQQIVAKLKAAGEEVD